MTPRFKFFAALFCAALAITVSATAQVSRTVMVNSNSGIILYPTNFWTVNALAARAGLSLGTAAQSNASAFQPASSVLANLSSGNAAALTNVQASNIVGIVALASNVSGIVGLANGGTGASNAVGVRSNLGLSASWLTNTNPASFLTAVGVETNYSGLFATRPWLTNTNSTTFRSAVLPSYSGNTNKVLAVNSNGTDVEWVIQTGGGTITSGVVAITNGGTGATNAATARTNLGLGWSALTNTNATNFRTAIGLGATWLTNTNSESFVAGLNLATNLTTASLSFVASGSSNRIILTETNEGPPAYNFIGSGSNNLIDSTSYGFIGSGRNNSIINGYQSQPSSIVGGYGNTIYTDYSFIGGGYENIIYGGYEGGYAVITGGRDNTSSNSETVVAGGLRNVATGRAAVVSGGHYNRASGYLSTVGGGGTTNSTNGNIASGNFSTISGGELNIASSNYSTVSGGSGNRAQHLYATVSGGDNNQAVGMYSVVAGGSSAYASGSGAVVVGGYQNQATGDYSFAAGNKARATNSGSFVWADHQNNLASTFSSAASDSFNVRASGGSYFNGGTLYVYKTNVGPFEGLINALNSNNTTLSNETLFRIGLAEATNKSAQFGFRVARTNNGGEGFAVFSVYGYNALMMIGPSDRSRTNTATNAGIEADIYSISTTNKVMTLITTNTGAMQMHRPIGFNTNAVAPTNPTNAAGWIEFYVGTNSVRVPYYQ